MIPYFELHLIQIGPVSIQTWGLFVAAGILAALFVGRRESSRLGLDKGVFTDFACWILIFAFILARLFHVFLYDLGTYIDDPLRILRLWDGGLSIFGGLIGAALGGWIFSRRKGISWWEYARVAAFVLPLGCGIGRIGCFMIHDHPGVLYSGLLAVDFPGGARFDHGLLLSLFGFLVFLAFLVLRRRSVGDRPPEYLPIFMVLYGSARLLLDFCRAWDLPISDVRYLYLTPAQYISVFLVSAGIYLLFRCRLQPGRAGVNP